MSVRAPFMEAPRRLNKEGSTLSLNALTRASKEDAGAAQRIPGRYARYVWRRPSLMNLLTVAAPLVSRSRIYCAAVLIKVDPPTLSV